MFKHKKLASNKLSKKCLYTLKIKSTKPIASPVKTNFNLKDIYDKKFLEQYKDEALLE